MCQRLPQCECQVQKWGEVVSEECRVESVSRTGGRIKLPSMYRPPNKQKVHTGKVAFTPYLFPDLRASLGGIASVAIRCRPRLGDSAVRSEGDEELLAKKGVAQLKSRQIVPVIGTNTQKI